MRTPMLTIARFASVALLLGLVGALRPSEARAATPPAGFHPGEGFVFRFSVGAVEAGEARMSVGAPRSDKEGASTVAVQAEARSAPWLSLLMHLNDTYQVSIDAARLAPVTLRIEEHGLRNRTVSATLAHDDKAPGSRMSLDYQDAKQHRKVDYHFYGRALDLLSTLFTLRAAPLRDGDALDLLAFDGPAFYRAVGKVSKRVRLTGASGPLPAILLDFDAARVDAQGHSLRKPSRHVRVWLSDDALRLPLRIEADTDFGLCQIELTNYVPGRAAAPTTAAGPQAGPTGATPTRPATRLADAE